MNLLQQLLADGRSYLRPLAKSVKGAAKATYNDVHRALGTGKEVEEPLYHQWRRVLRASAPTIANLPPQDGPRILLATGNGLSAAMLTLESILAMALRMRGAVPTALLCDKALPACEWNTFGNFNPPPNGFGPTVTNRTKLEQCRICTENIEGSHGVLPIGRASFGEVGLPDDVARISELVDGIPFDRYGDYVYRDVRVGEHAFGSVMRATLRGTLLDNPETRWLFRRYLIAAMLVVDLTERVFAQVKPDRVVAIHGIYVTHGTLCEVARKHGVHVVVYGTPYRKGTIWLSHHDTYHRTLISEPNAMWENMELTPARAKCVDDYLAGKRFGGRDYAAYHADSIDDHQALRQELGLDSTRPIVSLYTNVLWDAQLYYTHNAFSNMLEWLNETVRYFARRTDLQLVIRIHPAEARGAMPTNQPLWAEIQREFPTLPENVKVIKAESMLSSYALAEMSCAALIYGARMGVEIAALGTPLIVAGETFNRRKGYSHDVETREEYFALLDKVQDFPRNSPEVVERARKYAYHYYYRLMIDFPLFSVKNGLHMSGARLEIKDLSELAPGRCPALDLICQGIMDGTTPFAFDGDKGVTP